MNSKQASFRHQIVLSKVINSVKGSYCTSNSQASDKVLISVLFNKNKEVVNKSSDVESTVLNSLTEALFSKSVCVVL